MEHIKLYEEAVQIVNELGFTFLSKNKYDYISFEDITDENKWHTGLENDPWVWKDKIAYEKKAAYTKSFLKKPMFISWEWYPVFLAHYQPKDDVKTLYKNGLLSNYAKRIYDFLEEHDVLATYEIKNKLNVGNEKTKFDNAITELQRKMLITVCGSSQKKNKNGEPYGWFVSNYSLVDHWIDQDILEAGKAIDSGEAKERIVAKIREMKEDITDKELKQLMK